MIFNGVISEKAANLRVCDLAFSCQHCRDWYAVLCASSSVNWRLFMFSVLVVLSLSSQTRTHTHTNKQKFLREYERLWNWLFSHCKPKNYYFKRFSRQGNWRAIGSVSRCWFPCVSNKSYTRFLRLFCARHEHFVSFNNLSCGYIQDQVCFWAWIFKVNLIRKKPLQNRFSESNWTGSNFEHLL